MIVGPDGETLAGPLYDTADGLSASATKAASLGGASGARFPVGLGWEAASSRARGS